MESYDERIRHIRSVAATTCLPDPFLRLYIKKNSHFRLSYHDICIDFLSFANVNSTELL